MSFDHPWAWTALLLALPWWWFLRRGAPRRWTVGGLDPFRSAAASTRSTRWWPPWSWIILLAALICASAALAGLRTAVPPPLLLVDDSTSVQAVPVAEPAWPGARRVVGARGEPVAEAELLAELQRIGPRRVHVWTDRPRPRGLPSWVRWRDADFAAYRGPNAAILGVVPQARGRVAVHWLNDGIAEPLFLRCGEERLGPLDGGEGVTEITVPEGATRLTLEAGAGGAPDARADHAWTLHADPRFVVSEAFGARWDVALSAAWPGASVKRERRAQGEPAVELLAGGTAEGGSGASVALALDADPFAWLPEAVAVARVADAVRVARLRVQPPRARSECAASWQPLSASLSLADGAPGVDRRREAALTGLLLALAGLFLLRIGR